MHFISNSCFLVHNLGDNSYICAITNVHNNDFHNVSGHLFTEDVDNIDDDPFIC